MVQSTGQDNSQNQTLETVSVSDFFRQINWYGQSSLDAEGVESTELSYETVGQFFSTFPWQGLTPTVPADDWEPTKDNEISYTTDDSLTLEDLSALF